jgi:DNA mismatch repair protein MutS2
MHFTKSCAIKAVLNHVFTTAYFIFGEVSARMNADAMRILEYDKLKEILKQYAITEQAKKMLDELQPSVDLLKIERLMLETTEARRIIDINAGVPLTAMEKIDEVLAKAGKGFTLTTDELTAVKELLENVKKLKRFMRPMHTVSPVVASYALSMSELPHLSDEIERCVVNGRIDDRATPELNRIRKKIAVTGERIKQKLNSILSSPSFAGVIQEAVVTLRNGRYVIPVKREYKRSFPGNVLDLSASGSTLFIEPAAIARHQEELNLFKMEEEKEAFRILSCLTEMVEGAIREISINVEAFIHYDFIFAKAKYSKSLDCFPVKLNKQNKIRLKGGRHPFIGKSAVPLDFQIGGAYRALVITGPNTGGKTVALKTVGLLTLMAQSGLHVPVEEDSELAVFASILADIGDGQSIEQSLSTFSSHVKNISTIIESSSPSSLVLMDELGAGTDPGEGMGFAVAVLEEVFSKGATIVATTHISEIKEFANKKDGFKNGRMEFDIDSLKPLYRLTIGRPGDSNAFLIALRLGVRRQIIERAHEITYGERKDYSCEVTLQPKSMICEDMMTKDSQPPLKEAAAARPGTILKEKARKKAVSNFVKGDCVYISSMDRTGIVYEPENSRGEVVVMVMKKKYKINHKRLSLYVAAKDLYPEDYDLDIVFESKENRKKRKLMSKRHVEGVVIETPKEE